MTRTTLFLTNRSQAVRLPKEVAFPPGVREVRILRDGARRIVVPVDAVWDDFFDSPGIDLPGRDQPEAQRREFILMLRYMLDTNLCIRVLRDRPAGLRVRFNRDADALCISTIVLTELLHGAEKSNRPVENRREVDRMAGRLEVLPFDEAAAAHAAEIRAELERRGQSIGGYDVLIAGHARSRGLVVVTGNLREFNRVAGLRAEDWLAG